MVGKMNETASADVAVSRSPEITRDRMARGDLLTVLDYEERALQVLDKRAADYYKSGSQQQVTLTRNRSSLDDYVIRPRFLFRDVSTRSLSTTFLGCTVSMPIGVAPTAMQRMAHPDGELANARGRMYRYLQPCLLTLAPCTDAGSAGASVC